jgi:hypothetical protein
MTTETEAAVLEQIKAQEVLENLVTPDMLNPAAKGVWLRALRSHEDRQGQNALCSGERFCCLGVACEVAFQQDVRMDRKYGSDGLRYYDAMCQYLPPAVCRWLGIRESSLNPHVVIDGPGAEAIRETVELDDYREGEVVGLAELNDAGVPFRIIADLIERQM